MKGRSNNQVAVQNETFVQAVQKVFREFCSNSTIHGIRYLTQRHQHWTERLWWFVAIGLSVSLCGLTILEICSRWRENPVNMNFARMDEPFSAIPFPMVTICPEVKTSANVIPYRMNESKANLSDISQSKMEALLQICDIHEPSTFGDSSKQFTNESIYDTIMDIVPPFNRTWIGCIWKSRAYNCSELFKPIWINEGLCYAFNALNSRDIYTNEMVSELMTVNNNPDVTNWRHDNGYGDEVTEKDYPFRVFSSKLNGALTIYLSILRQDLELDICRGQFHGFRVILTAPDETAKIIRQSFLVSLLEQVDFKIKAQVVTTSDGLRANRPKQRECYFDSENHLRFFKHYRRNNCYEECLANFTLKECGCEIIIQKFVCGPGKIECYQEAENKLYGQDIIEGLTDRGAKTFRNNCRCLSACTAIVYDAEVDRSKFDWKAFLTSNDVRLDNFEDIQPSKLIIHFKNKPVSTLKRAEAFTTAHFMSICGGLLGLFLGVSMLSIIEFLYYSTLHLYWTLRSWKATNATFNRNQNELNNLKLFVNDLHKVHPTKY